MLGSRMLSHHFHFSSVMSYIPRMSLWRHPYHILIKGLAESALWTSRKLCSAWCMRYCWLHRYEETLVTSLPSPVFILSCRVRLATCYCPAVTTECCRLKDDGDGLTGPQPSILGSVDKVFNKVNSFDQYQCLQVLTNTQLHLTTEALLTKFVYFRKWFASSWGEQRMQLWIQWQTILVLNQAKQPSPVLISSSQIQGSLFKMFQTNWHRMEGL